MLKLAFVSQKLTPTEFKWSTIETQGYAVIWESDNFEMLSIGTTILFAYVS